MARGTSRYDGFISYSRALDGDLAPALQTGLEQFAKPWYRPRALRVFRDATSLSANPGLWSSIEAALASSAWLVLMASPEAARSPWVNREVTWWRENKSPQRLLVVLTEGEYAWADDARHCDETTAALPPALRGAFDEKPRWVDLRWLHDADQVDQSNPRLRECVADVAAAVREVPKDELVGEHIRQHRRTMRLARGGVTTLAVLLIAAIVAAVVAVGQRNQAVAAPELLATSACSHQTGAMREAFAHEAVLSMAAGADECAPGAAVTLELCGHWEHEPPCPVAAHHSCAERVGRDVQVRILFATEPERETEVRHRIDVALSAGQLCGPDGLTTGWTLRSSRRSDVFPDETDHAQCLLLS
ncbi:MAG: toll/interleukin-1 receptor domain-containing protein [Pseudonocardiales bacterium]